jgi:hypothetical protein
MLHDLLKDDDPQVEAVLSVIHAIDADVILLGDVDWDAQGAGPSAVRLRLLEAGLAYTHAVHLRPNSGLPSGFDLNQNGIWGEPRDALAYGRFTGSGGLLLLSRLPLGEAEDLSHLLWAENAGEDVTHLLPPGSETLVPLATVAQWVVPLEVAGTRLTLVTLAASTPVFDGPEDRNGLRGRDELALAAKLAGEVEGPILLGRANLDPRDGEGRREAIRALINHPALQDPRPRSPGGAAQPDRTPPHRGDPALDTADWEGPGPLRVDYVLPARDLSVIASGVHWPAPGEDGHEEAIAAGPGRAVWVDLEIGSGVTSGRSSGAGAELAGSVEGGSPDRAGRTPEAPPGEAWALP